MRSKKRIIFFTKYSDKSPSSRYRSYQYKKYFTESFDIEYLPFFDEYISKMNLISFFNLLFYFFRRIFYIIKNLNSNNLFFIEYELIPYFPPLFEYLIYHLKIPYILDYDDAIFHNYDQNKSKIIRFILMNKIRDISKMSNFIISGSPYLTRYFNSININVIEIPTSISIEKYKEYSTPININSKTLIGWIGSKTTSINILLIKDVFETFEKINSNLLFILIGFDKKLKSQLNFTNIKFIDWTESEELYWLNKIDLGIMPLIDNPFNQGKCGFKLIQYMGMSKPTLSTPLESNLKINRNNFNMFAISSEDYIYCINNFILNKEFFKKVGLDNFNIAKTYYSIENNANLYLKIFKSI